MELIAEVSTSIDADTERVTVELFEGKVVLRIEGTNGQVGHSTFLTSNEARRVSRALDEAAGQAKGSGTVHLDAPTPDHIIPGGYQR